MAKKIILFLIIVSMTQNSKSQNLTILDAKFSPLSNIIALTVGDDKNSNLRLYFSEKNELTGNIFRDSLNRTTVREFEFSPDGDKIALLLTTSTMITDLFLYDVKKAELIRCTNSVGLKNIDFAFVCMNLPYTMDVQQAAQGVLAFKPKVVYPYHYRGQDVNVFKNLVNAANNKIQVRLRNWYGKLKE